MAPKGSEEVIKIVKLGLGKFSLFNVIGAQQWSKFCLKLHDQAAFQITKLRSDRNRSVELSHAVLAKGSSTLLCSHDFDRFTGKRSEMLTVLFKSLRRSC